MRGRRGVKAATKESADSEPTTSSIPTRRGVRSKIVPEVQAKEDVSVPVARGKGRKAKETSETAVIAESSTKRGTVKEEVDELDMLTPDPPAPTRRGGRVRAPLQPESSLEQQSEDTDDAVGSSSKKVPVVPKKSTAASRKGKAVTAIAPEADKENEPDAVPVVKTRGAGRSVKKPVEIEPAVAVTAPARKTRKR